MQNNYSNAGAGSVDGRTPDRMGQEIIYAGFWVRLAAYAIDSVIVFAGLLIVRIVLLGMSPLTDGTFLGGNILFHYTLKDMILYGVQVFYFILCTYHSGTTPGKRVMNLRVVSAGGKAWSFKCNISGDRGSFPQRACVVYRLYNYWD